MLGSMSKHSSQSFSPTLSVHKAARLLGVTAPTVYQWVRQGEIPSIRLGGRIRIPTALLADLLGLKVGQLAEFGDGSDDPAA